MYGRSGFQLRILRQGGRYLKKSVEQSAYDLKLTSGIHELRQYLYPASDDEREWFLHRC